MKQAELQEPKERQKVICCIKLTNKPWDCLNVAYGLILTLCEKNLFETGRHPLAFLKYSLHKNLARFYGCICSLGLNPKGIPLVMFSFLPCNIHFVNAF